MIMSSQYQRIVELEKRVEYLEERVAYLESFDRRYAPYHPSNSTYAEPFHYPWDQERKVWC